MPHCTRPTGQHTVPFYREQSLVYQSAGSEFQVSAFNRQETLVVEEEIYQHNRAIHNYIVRKNYHESAGS